MKRVFTIAIALLAFVVMASAQDETVEYDLNITTVQGEVQTIHVFNIKSMTFTETPDPDDGWTSLGYFLYGEDFIASLFYWTIYNDDMPVPTDYFCCEYYVEVQEKDDQPGYYRLVDPYAPDIYPFSEYITYDTTEHHYYLEIDATYALGEGNGDGVLIPRQYIGVIVDGYGEIGAYSQASYWMDYYGYTLEWEIWAMNTGHLSNGVITFPASSLLVEYGGNFWYAGVNDTFKVDFNYQSDAPGPKDGKMKSRGKDGEMTLNQANHFAKVIESKR